ncbi:hypothetical protein [Microbacterium sp. A94]|uniref:hypothetical protein n=1 Tax=Microbacterium sp. A94 TaxID=3450717 RepID=UPI003F44009E
MTSLRSRTNRYRMLALLTLAAGTLCACTPTPAPSPTPTAAFANEEEAFAAAEEIYRAYTHALNSQRSGIASSDPAGFLVGAALEEHLSSERDLAERKITLEGDTVLEQLVDVEADLDSDPITLIGVVCLDIGDTRVIGEDGTDLTPALRAPQAALQIQFMAVDDTFSISDSTVDEGSEC